MMKAVLVSDFDGTMTANDFYKLAAAELLPPDALAPWQEYRAGTLTHFEALRRIFSRIRAPQATVRELVDRMAPDPALRRCVRLLRAAGWGIVVASAGCDWYIRRVLAEAGVPVDAEGGVELHANPGDYSPEEGLCMTAPQASPFFCIETGVDKAAIVRFHQQRGAMVAFAGDGFADMPAALATLPELRFARADLSAALQEQKQAARPFTRWAEVADALLALGEMS